MKKFIIAFFLSTVLASPVMADDVEMHSFTCQEFMQNEKALPHLIMWIDGYVSVLAEDTVINDAWLEKLTDHIVNTCLENPKASVIDIINALD